MRHISAAALWTVAVLLSAVAAVLILYGFLLGMRAGTPEQEQWYNSIALVPLVPGILAAASASWLIRRLRGR